MKPKHKLLLAASVVGLPAVVLAATVQFQNFSDSGAVIQVSGQMPGTIARLERSTDLTVWTPVAAQTVAPDGTAFLVHALTPGDPRGFYRVAAEPAPRPGSVVQVVCNMDQQNRDLPFATRFDYNAGSNLITQGVAYPQLDTTFTPTRTGNKIMVEVHVPAALSGDTHLEVMEAALFMNGAADAVAAACDGGGFHFSGNLDIRYCFTATATSPVTLQLRLSAHGNPGTIMVNKNQHDHSYGNRLASSMTITEIQQ